MAEIKIEKKKPIWPYIIAGLIVLALIGYFVISNNNEENTGEAIYADDTTTQQMATQNDNDTSGPVTSYLRLIDDSRGNMGIDHVFTNQALLNLVNAVEATAKQVGFDNSSDIDQARTYANAIAKDPYETSHADKIGKAAHILANTMHNMQQSKFENLTNEAKAVKDAAEKIDPAKLTLDQKDAVHNFFNSAADLLRKMDS